MYIYICNVLCHCQNYFKTTCIPLLLRPHRFLCSQVMGFHYPPTKPDQSKKTQLQGYRLREWFCCLAEKKPLASFYPFILCLKHLQKLQALIPPVEEKFLSFFSLSLSISFLLCFCLSSSFLFCTGSSLLHSWEEEGGTKMTERTEWEKVREKTSDGG